MMQQDKTYMERIVLLEEKISRLTAENNKTQLDSARMLSPFAQRVYSPEHAAQQEKFSDSQEKRDHTPTKAPLIDFNSSWISK